METQLEQIRDNQKAAWDKSAPGWKKWDDLTMDFLRPFGDEMIRLLKPQDGDAILDVAAGTGEPGLTMAMMIKNGKVICTDLSDGMLEIARENAAKRGISNFETLTCDVSELPFADNTFDVLSCRMGFMFFPDMLLATKEMTRVIKPGGRIAASVWDVPQKNFWFTAAMTSVSKNMEMPAPPPGLPGMFRCAESGLIANLFRQAGLKNVCEQQVSGALNSQTAEVYWSFISEAAGPIVAALAKADDGLKAKIKEEVIDLVNQKYPSGNVKIDSNALVIYGEK